MMGMQQPGEPKGDYKGLLRDFGVSWVDTQILYDSYNPHPTFADVPPHVIFVSERPDGTDPFHDADPVVDGLTEVVTLFAGEIKPASGQEGGFTPLLVTGKTAGFNVFDDMVSRHVLFGLSGPVIPRKRGPITGEQHVIAARVQTAGESSGEEGASGGTNMIVVADLDLFGDQFFAMHARGGDIDGDGLDDIRFDNVTFLLNAMDSLVGDERFVDLRKRRPEYRRLTQVEELTREARDEREKEMEAANAAAETELSEAQAALDAAVAEIRDRPDLDETTKQIMIKSVEAAENRRLQARTERIELDKARKIGRIEVEHARKVDEVRDRIRLMAVLIPPLPALLLGAAIFARKRRRERETIPDERRRGGKPGASKPEKAKDGGAA
jgi:ABC-2 type transport system permease protein